MELTHHTAKVTKNMRLDRSWAWGKPTAILLKEASQKKKKALMEYC